MKSNGEMRDLIETIADLDEKATQNIVRRRIESGDDPLLILRDCQKGIHRVGEYYEQKRYYLAGLIMGGEIFRMVMDLLQPVMEMQISARSSGRILIGTVRGDIHDVGKNIVNMLLSCHQYTVYDLGIDVQPSEFVKQSAEVKPDIIALSGLLTSSFDAMQETVSLLRSEGVTIPVVIGGGRINEEVCRYIGADHWIGDAVNGVNMINCLLNGEGGD